MINEHCIDMSAISNPFPSSRRRWFWSLKSFKQIVVEELFKVLLCTHILYLRMFVSLPWVGIELSVTTQPQHLRTNRFAQMGNGP